MADHTPNQLQALLLQEQQALEQGTNMWRAAVSEELNILLSGLGIGQEAAQQAMLTTAYEARQQSMLDAKATAESIRAARILLLGDRATQWAAQPNEQTIPTTVEYEVDSNATNEVGQEEAAVIEVLPAVPTALTAEVVVQRNVEKEDVRLETVGEVATASTAEVESVEAELISEKAFRKLLAFFGEENADRLQNCTVAQAETYIEAMVTMLVSKKYMLARFKEVRIEEWRERIINDADWNQFNKGGSARQTYYNAVHTFINRITPEERRQLLIAPVTLIPQQPIVEKLSTVANESLQETPLEFFIPEVITDELLQKAKKLVVDIYGKHQPSDLEELSFATCMLMISESLAIVTKYGDVRMAENIGVRKHILLALLYTNKTPAKISKELNKSRMYTQNVMTAYYNAVHKIISKLNTHNSTAEESDIITLQTSNNTVEEPHQAESNRTPELIPAVGTAVIPNEMEYVGVVEDEHTTPRQLQQEIQADGASPNEAASEDAFEAIATVLHYSDEASFKLLQSLFDITRTEPEYSSEARNVYDDIASLLEHVQTNKRYSNFAATLEFKVLYLISQGDSDLRPLAPAAVHLTLENDLNEANREFADVIQEGFRQLAAIRKEVMGKYSAI